ncbi:ABC transporter permease subunit [Actinomadura viridis]|uniref:ABC transporter permease subunit n=1 Tax=Actinomadura viridis TaxID=58110 RepID=UPI0036809F0A
MGQGQGPDEAGTGIAPGGRTRRGTPAELIDALAAEWIKLRSVRSTAFILAAVLAFLLLCALWSWYATRYWDGLSPEDRASARMALPEQPLVLALPVCAAVLGTLSITSEYATGTIRGALAAVPRRGTLLTAKVVILGAVTAVTALVCVTAAVAAGHAIAGDRPFPEFRTPVTEQAAHLLALATATTMIALVACGIGTALRSTAATVTAAVISLMVLPPLTNLVPSPWGPRLASALPANLADQIAAAPARTQDPGVLSPAAAAAVMAAYVAAALALGAVTFVRKDP